MEIQNPGSHLDHLLRQTRMHHVQLSTMADMKANILLTMSSVVLTLSIGHLDEPRLIRWATLVLMGACLLTILLATYAVMPHVSLSLRPRAAPDVTSKRFNILFFGDFLHLDYDAYEAAMDTVMSSPDRTYEAQVREIYLLGSFLAKKKYRFLRLAYIALIAGFVLSCGLILTHTLARTGAS